MDTNVAAGLYDVGGVMMERPFKAGRLGHVGLYNKDCAASVTFYGDLLGYRLTDTLRPNPTAPELQLNFMSYNADHHGLVMVPNAFGVAMDPYFAKGITINQLSFQVGSLAEVMNAHQMMRQHDVSIFRVGRDSPGSNWAVYFRDPDGHMVEIYYGMEQLGWDGLSKPIDQFKQFAYEEEPAMPQPSEAEEIRRVQAAGGSLASGHRAVDADLPSTYDVEGVLLPRPFKVIHGGPVHLFVADLDASLHFYEHEMGFARTEEITYRGHRIAFLRTGSEHHCLGLYPVALRAELGLGDHTSLLSYGMQVGSYRQLRDAARFLLEKGCTFVDLPPELFPGIDYTTHVVDPDGHCVQLYYYMEQIGWDGRPRPQSARRVAQTPWPETLSPLSDTYANRHFQGPLG